ncbi:hypothetical protein [Brucella sp. 10RB9215]|uniref:hypothetical protein n=1 Tax=Brucella sp. 10RB9215 TaxID=1149953 RepID=UPI0010FDAD6D|nr:hypothetical protein [Brucella sp. 10RB9215]
MTVFPIRPFLCYDYSAKGLKCLAKYYAESLMLYLVETFWPVLVLAILIGSATGWLTAGER